MKKTVSYLKMVFFAAALLMLAASAIPEKAQASGKCDFACDGSMFSCLSGQPRCRLDF